MVCCGFTNNLICAIIDYDHSISVIQFTYSIIQIMEHICPYSKIQGKMKIQVCMHIAKSRIETLEVSFIMLIIVI